MKESKSQLVPAVDRALRMLVTLQKSNGDRTVQRGAGFGVEPRRN